MDKLTEIAKIIYYAKPYYRFPDQIYLWEDIQSWSRDEFLETAEEILKLINDGQ